MYAMFAALVSLAVYCALVVVLRHIRQAPSYSPRLAPVSLMVLGAALIVFNLASRVLGVDLGPGYEVSNRIPDDYLAKGAMGTIALIPYALACLSPVLARALIRR